MKNYDAVGRVFFAIAVVASGVLQLMRHDFVRLVPKAVMSIPWPHFWAGASGAVLVVLGLAIAVDRKRWQAAIGLAGLFLAVLLLYVPEVCANPGALFMWGNPCKSLALLSGALLIAAMSSPSNLPTVGLSKAQARQICAVCMGVFLFVCGVMHFVYLDFVVQMVPAWMPGRSFWGCFTGVALLAGGIGIALPLTARVAALLSGLMIFLWIVMLHIPRAFASWPDAGETAAIFEALALSGTALLLVSNTRSGDSVTIDATTDAKDRGGRRHQSEFPWQ